MTSRTNIIVYNINAIKKKKKKKKKKNLIAQ